MLLQSAIHFNTFKAKVLIFSELPLFKYTDATLVSLLDKHQRERERGLQWDQ